jgi:hypothetical protein
MFRPTHELIAICEVKDDHRDNCGDPDLAVSILGVAPFPLGDDML